jgi:hypothetical protein
LAVWITGRELAEYWFFRFHPVEAETVACSYFTPGASPEWLRPAVHYVTLAYYWAYNAMPVVLALMAWLVAVRGHEARRAAPSCCRTR